MLHDVGNNRDCDVDVDHRNNTKNTLLLSRLFHSLPHGMALPVSVSVTWASTEHTFNVADIFLTLHCVDVKVIVTVNHELIVHISKSL